MQTSTPRGAQSPPPEVAAKPAPNRPAPPAPPALSSKQGLGRGLGILLDSTKTSTDSPEGSRIHISPGMATLLRGTNSPPLQPAPDLNERKGEPRSVLIPSLVIADLMLVVLATVLVLRHRPIGPWEVALCSAAFIVGAWLACLAFWRR